MVEHGTLLQFSWETHLCVLDGCMPLSAFASLPVRWGFAKKCSHLSVLFVPSRSHEETQPNRDCQADSVPIHKWVRIKSPSSFDFRLKLKTFAMSLKRKADDLASEGPKLSWTNAGSTKVQEEQEASEELQEHPMWLYATGALSGKDLCILSYWISKSGARGDWSSLASKPGQSTGNYTKKLARIFQKRDDLEPHYIDVPVQSFQRARSVKRIPFRAPHECLAAEAASSSLLEAAPEKDDWMPAFEQHPIVIDALANGKTILPSCLYLDGIRFTRAISVGRSDSILAFFCYSLLSQKRVLLGVLRKSEYCRCGCRGWCTVWPVLAFLSWSYRVGAGLLDGKSDWLSMPFPEGSPHLEKPEMTSRLALLMIKGDWSEYVGSLGMPSWATKYQPCIWCCCQKENMYNFSECRAGGHNWGKKDWSSYSSCWQSCEKKVLVRTEAERNILVGALMFDKRKDRIGGRVIGRDVPSFNLLKDDRLEPSIQLPDTHVFRSATLPVELTFWRRHTIGKACTDLAHRNNPLFSYDICGSIQNVLRVDLLHTLYLGVMVHYVGATIWKLIQANAMGINSGSVDIIRVQSCARLRSHLFQWYDSVKLDKTYRLGDFTIKMIGSVPGGQLTTKAAETAPLVNWCCQLCDDFPDFPHSAILKRAGLQLKEYIRLVRESPERPSPLQCQQMFDCFILHTKYLERSDVGMLPKHHAWGHVVMDTAEVGNPRTFSCFLDESINCIVARIAEKCHRLTFEVSIFRRLAVLPWLRRSENRKSYFAAL